MGCQDCNRKACYKKRRIQSPFSIKLQSEGDLVIALAGNPNVGKSTVFNYLTGLKQHTGNWPGKTVSNARGSYFYKKRRFVLVDLPGTYSLLANSTEEQIARDFICFGEPRTTVVVVDATCLERNLNLVLQVMEMTDQVVVCLNLMDEAEKKGIDVDVEKLEQRLGVPVVATSARNGHGLKELMEKIYGVALGKIKCTPKKMVYSKEVEAVIEKLVPSIERLLKGRLNAKWVALRLLEGDTSILDSIYKYIDEDLKELGEGCQCMMDDDYEIKNQGGEVNGED